MGQHRDKIATSNVIPLFSKDEMNLVEFPFGPITTGSTKTLEIDHPVYDRQLKRVVNRRLIITGADAFGLPRPIDEQVLIGLKDRPGVKRPSSRPESPLSLRAL